MDAATKTSIRLAEYEDVLPRRDIYSLIALAAYHAADYNVCSRAFIKLETLDDLEQSESDEIQALALTIFTKKAPSDHSDLAQCYIACLETGTPYHACTKTGRAVLDGRTLMCSTCRHHAFEVELRGANHCPLCHTTYPAQTAAHTKAPPQPQRRCSWCLCTLSRVWRRWSAYVSSP